MPEATVKGPVFAVVHQSTVPVLPKPDCDAQDANVTVLPDANRDFKEDIEFEKENHTVKLKGTRNIKIFAKVPEVLITDTETWVAVWIFLIVLSPFSFSLRSRYWRTFHACLDSLIQSPLVGGDDT